jgi:hypothetical protein
MVARWYRCWDCGGQVADEEVRVTRSHDTRHAVVEVRQEAQRWDAIKGVMVPTLIARFPLAG